MTHLHTLLSEHPDWVVPRSDQHTVIGVPNSRDHRKTFVEPGGSFSPGVATCGVTVWIYDHTHKRFYAPEELASSELHWQWALGYLPLLQSRWRAGAVIEQELFASQLQNEQNVVNTLSVTASNPGDTEIQLSLYLVVRPYGPAGGPLRQLAMHSDGVEINGKTVILAQQPASTVGAVSFTKHRQEISELLRKGERLQQQAVTDQAGLCSGALVYDLTLAPGVSQTLSFDLFVHPLEHNYLAAFQRYHAQSYAEKRAHCVKFWQQQLHIVQLDLPDTRFRDAFYSTLAQMLMGTVDHEVRIATITYPLFWLRDGAYLINALDKAGLHDAVRAQLSHCLDRIFAGGFGAEPDAFGEGIWIFLTHFQLTHDLTWLQEVYPWLKARAEWIIKARHTQEYLYADTEARVPSHRFVADTDLICEPARDGLIQGRMDWHRPLIWINAFALLGLQGITGLAAELGYSEDAERYSREANELHQALQTYAQSHFGENERDTVCALWPTGAFLDQRDELSPRFEDWWQRVRLQGRGTYTPEPLWKYFELGQAHNYLYLGERDKVLETLNYYLTHHDVQNLYGWLEDDHDVAEYWSQIEGWYTQPSRQPHGWVSSELFLLLRDMLLYEEGTTLIIGSGIPRAWLEAGTPITFAHLPTHFGVVDTTIIPQDNEIAINVHFASRDRLPERIALHLPWDVKRLRVPLGTIEGKAFNCVTAGAWEADPVPQTAQLSQNSTVAPAGAASQRRSQLQTHSKALIVSQEQYREHGTLALHLTLA